MIEDKSEPMFMVYQNKKLAYINRYGEFVLKTDFYGGSDFHEGRACISKRKNTGLFKGFINRDGEIIVPPVYDEVACFSEGLCGVKKENRWGFIDLSGNEVIPAIYDEISDFSCGLAATRKFDEDIVRYIDKNGITIFSVKDRLNIFSEGLLTSRDEGKTRRWGFRNTSGNWYIEPQFSNAQHYSEGLAGVETYVTKKEQKTGFIDHEGRLVLPYIYTTLKARFSCGRSVVYDYNKTKKQIVAGCIDKNGELVIPFSFYSINDFSEDMAAAWTSEGDEYFGYINKKGEYQTPVIFKTLNSPFKNGLARVWTDDGFGYINKQGDFVWKIKKTW